MSAETAPGTGARVLVVDDEASIRRFLRVSLVAHGYEVVEAASLAEGLSLATLRRPDLILLDLGLGDGDGGELLETVRAWSSVPVIVLSVRDSEDEKVRLLDLGADDYVTKPFLVGELLARLRAALRKQARREDAAPVYRHAGLCIDLGLRQVQRDGHPVALTRKEYAVLAFLARHAGRVVGHRQLLEQVWGPVHRDDVQYLRVIVQQLRAKLGDPAEAPRLLLTESGVGYRLAAPDGNVG
jgi:two-component system KDP operon response regulator KdpE